jgi:hypothetical protein
MAEIPKNKTTKCLGELMAMARRGEIYGFAYALVREDSEGTLEAGTNAIWNGDHSIQAALHRSMTDLTKRLTPPASTLTINGSLEHGG